MASPTRALGLLSVLLAASQLLACRPNADSSQAEAKPKTSVTVSIGYQKTGVPFFLRSHSESLENKLRAKGVAVRWVEFQAGPQLLEGMRGDGVDIGHTGEAPPIFAQSGKVPFVYVASGPSSPKAEAILVTKESPIKQLAELKGKRVALNRGSNVHYLLVRALESVGLQLSDVQVVFLAPADARTAFESGTVDAWVIWDPFLAAAEVKGARVLANGEGLVDNRFFYLARRAFAETHPELLDLIIDEFAVQGVWAREHPKEVAKLLAEASGIPYEALLLAEQRHVHGVSRIDAQVLEKQQAVADVFAKLEVIPAPVRPLEAAWLKPADTKRASQP